VSNHAQARDIWLWYFFDVKTLVNNETDDLLF